MTGRIFLWSTTVLVKNQGEVYFVFIGTEQSWRQSLKQKKKRVRLFTSSTKTKEYSYSQEHIKE